MIILTPRGCWRRRYNRLQYLAFRRARQARLPYVASLGIDAIWISPFFKSPMADFGYDIADYRAVDPLFGTLADFDELLADAHRLGLKVMIDQVLSHASIEHEWFCESRQSRDNPRADWYVWADPRADGSPPNNWLSIFGGIAWQWEPRRAQYYLHNFLAAQPDLNFHSPAVRRAVRDNPPKPAHLRIGAHGAYFGRLPQGPGGPTLSPKKGSSG